MLRTELPRFAVVFAVFKADVYTVTLDLGHSTALTLSWDISGEDPRVVVSQRSPLGHTLTVYDDAIQASDDLKDPPFELLADAVEFERAIQRARMLQERAAAAPARRQKLRVAARDAA